MQIAVVILLLVAVGAVVGGATVVGAPIFALPILALVGAVWAAVAIGRRTLGRAPRERHPVDFTAEDRATMVPSPSGVERRRNRERAAAELRR